MIGQKGNPITDRKVWPRRSGARFPTPAHLSNWSAHFGLQPASGRPLRPEGLAKAILPTPTPRLRPEYAKNPVHCSSPTDAIRADWDQPTGDVRSVRTRKRMEKVRQDVQVKTVIPGTVPCAPVRQYPTTLLTRQNSSSVVGADIFPYSVVGAINSHTRRIR